MQLEIMKFSRVKPLQHPLIIVSVQHKFTKKIMSLQQKRPENAAVLKHQKKRDVS